MTDAPDSSIPANDAIVPPELQSSVFITTLDRIHILQLPDIICREGGNVEHLPVILSSGRRIAAQKAGVGPMAGVAGAMAEFVGKALLTKTSEVVVENGGDIFLQSSTERRIGIFADCSPLSMRVGIRVLPEKTPLGVCTSSGTVGPSLSLGKADAVCVISPSATLADAAATAVGNLVQGKGDIERALERGRAIPGVEGIVIIVGDAMGAWGEYELVTI